VETSGLEDTMHHAAHSTLTVAMDIQIPRECFMASSRATSAEILRLGCRLEFNRLLCFPSRRLEFNRLLCFRGYADVRHPQLGAQHGSLKDLYVCVCVCVLIYIYIYIYIYISKGMHDCIQELLVDMILYTYICSEKVKILVS
jgi:hypothetical protein